MCKASDSSIAHLQNRVMDSVAAHRGRIAGRPTASACRTVAGRGAQSPSTAHDEFVTKAKYRFQLRNSAKCGDCSARLNGSTFATSSNWEKCWSSSCRNENSRRFSRRSFGPLDVSEVARRLYGPLNTAVDSATAAQWAKQLQTVETRDPALPFALMQLAFAPAIATRDLPDAARQGVAQWLESHNAPQHLTQLVRDAARSIKKNNNERSANHSRAACSSANPCAKRSPERRQRSASRLRTVARS